MLQAQGYTPALLYVEAEEDIQKYMAVSILPGGKVKPSDISDGVVVGFARQDALAGESLPVQVDGVLYGYQRKTLNPGVWYYQGNDGEILETSAGGGHIVGFAVTEDIFRIFIWTGSSSSLPSSPAEIISGSSALDSIMDDKESEIVDGSGSLSEAVEEGWDDWDSIGSDGTLTDLFMGGKIESDDSSKPSEKESTTETGIPNVLPKGEESTSTETEDDKPQDSDTPTGWDGGTLSDLFGLDETEGEDEDSNLFNGDLGSLLTSNGGEDDDQSLGELSSLASQLGN